MFKTKFYYGWVIVAASFLMLLVTSGIVMSFGVFMKPLVKDFKWDRASVSLAVASFMLVQGFLSPLVGRLIDRYGAKKVITVGVTILGVTMILFSQVKSYWAFFITYGILAAIGYSTTTLMTNSVLISKWFQERKKGLALGISTMGFPFGPLAFSPLIGLLIVSYSWRWAALLLGLFLLVVLMPLMLWLVKDHDSERVQAAKPDPKNRITFSKLASDKQYVRLASAYFGCGFTMALISTHFPIYAIDLGLTQMVAASAFGIMGAFSAFGTFSAGALSDKLGRKNLLTTVYLTRALALCILALTQTTGGLYAGAVLFGLSWTATGPLTTALTGDIWGTKVMGAVFGYVFLVHQFGAALGSYTGGLIFDSTGKYQLAFLLGAAILISSGINAFFIREPSRQSPNLNVSNQLTN